MRCPSLPPNHQRDSKEKIRVKVLSPWDEFSSRGSGYLLGFPRTTGHHVAPWGVVRGAAGHASALKFAAMQLALSKRFAALQQQDGWKEVGFDWFPTLGSSILCLFWWRSQLEPQKFKKAKNLKVRRRKTCPTESIYLTSRRLIACRWVGKRRYRRLKLNWRKLGKHKRYLLIHKTRSARFSPPRVSHQQVSHCSSPSRSHSIGSRLFGTKQWRILLKWWQGRRDVSFCHLRCR